MGWKPKEKQLTAEEAIELARKDLAPYWLNGDPLLAGVRDAAGRASVHPLSKAFDKKAWLLLFADLTTYCGESLLLYTREWVKRYSAHDLGCMLVVRPSFPFLSSTRGLHPILKKTVETFPVVLDHEGLIGEAFGVDAKNLPAAKLLHQRKLLFGRSGVDWVDGAEREIQVFLRKRDPGLPLAPPFELPPATPRDLETAECGLRSRSPLLKVEGPIQQETQRMVIKDPTTWIRFKSPSPRVSIVASSAMSANEVSRARFELGGDAVFESAAATDLVFADDGGADIRLGEPRLYHALQALPERTREVAVRFPDADRLPVAIYAIRFADR